MALVVEPSFHRHGREQFDWITIWPFCTACRRVLQVECAVQLRNEVDQKPGLEVFVPDEVAVAEGAGIGGDMTGRLRRRLLGPGLTSPVGVFGLVSWMGDRGTSDVDGLC